MTGRRQPGLFDEYDPPGDPAPLALDPAAAFEFYRRAVGDPALHRSRVYPEFARGPLPAPAAADWLTLAAVLLGDRPATRPTRERVTVLVGGFDAGLRYEVPRAAGAERVAADARGRFLVVAHSALGLTVVCRLVESREVARLTARWAEDAAAHFARRGRTPWRTAVAWEYLAGKGEQVFKVRDGLLYHPNIPT